MNNKNRQAINCSELGLVAKCAKAYAFKVSNTKQSQKAMQRMKVGNAQHNQFNRQIKQQENKDKRCYVATHLYGENALETQRLRAFRDSVLLKSSIGRFIVAKYYLHSPSVIQFCKTSRTLNICMSVPVRIIVATLFLFDRLHYRASRKNDE